MLCTVQRASYRAAGNKIIAMPNKADRKKLSHLLSRILRHTAPQQNISLRPDGFVPVSALLNLQNIRDKYVFEDIDGVVKDDAKGRYTMRQEVDGNWYIRANQGHSFTLESLELSPITDPVRYPTVLHGTSDDAWHNHIKHEGLRPMKRNHIHCAKGRFGEVKSGVRKNCLVFIYIDLAKAMSDGIQFYESANEVILTSGKDGVLSPTYFEHVESSTGELLYSNKTSSPSQIPNNTRTDTRKETQSTSHQNIARQRQPNSTDTNDVTDDMTRTSLVDLKSKQLFGGHLQCLIPSSFLDASEMRDIPDHQEVFLDPAHDNISLIIEIVESAQVSVEQVGRTHYSNLASDNDAVSHSIQASTITSPSGDKVGERILVVGTQAVAKFNAKESEDICIVMGVLRLPSVESDILITCNAPINYQSRAEEMVRQALNTITVLDWRLFS